jgi:hypothetical protein
MLQVSILPTDFTGYPATAIAASMRPALEMSGDFYGVFPVGNGGWTSCRGCLRQGRGGGVLHGARERDAVPGKSRSTCS